MLGTLIAFMVAAPLASPIVMADTRMDEIAARYFSSHSAQRQVVLGWTSGRCYGTGAPNQAIGAVLVSETRERMGEDGPIFDRPVTKLAVLVHNPKSYQYPDYFDKPTPKRLREIAGAVDAVFVDNQYSEVSEDGEAMYSTNTAVSTRWYVRHDGQYSFVRIVNDLNGDDYGYCYFFKKLK